MGNPASGNGEHGAGSSDRTVRHARHAHRMPCKVGHIHEHSEAGFRFEDWDMGVEGAEKKKALLALMLQAKPNAMANLLDLEC